MCVEPLINIEIFISTIKIFLKIQYFHSQIFVIRKEIQISKFLKIVISVEAGKVVG